MRELVALWILVPPFVVTLIVTQIGIGNRELWRDETATWFAASLSLSDLSKFVRIIDMVLWPYYAFMHEWVVMFGDSPTALRTPASIGMALASSMIVLVGRRLFGAPAGLAAGLLFAAVPAISRYGQEVRPYGIVMLATVSAILLLLRAVERPSVWRFLAYGLAVAWIGCSHVIALLSLASHVVIALSAYRRNKLWILIGWPVALVMGLAIASPVIIGGQRQGGTIGWIPDATWARVEAFPGDLFDSPAVAGFFVVAGIGALVALALGKRAWTAVFLATWALFPPIFGYYTFHEFYFFLPRYSLFTVPAWALLAGFAVRQIIGASSGAVTAGAIGRGIANARSFAKVLTATVLAGGMLTFLAWESHVAVRDPAGGGEFAFRDGAAYIQAREKPGDGVIFTGYPNTHRGFRYYWRDRPLSEQPREVLVDQAKVIPYSWDRPACADPVPCLGDTERIWLVSTDPSGIATSPLNAVDQKAVEARYTVTEHVEFTRMWVSLLVRKPAK
ncbi:glycosyltransferase family 39 protein [Winogradskya humida]|uniref:glycosyltransferase family 39 protein n=1 Tax=Winogradskya humida TaxID=113566 RepID=UPI0019458D2C|nr:glycosyltransferase family 39 protein [Actinoplanes humidus]